MRDLSRPFASTENMPPAGAAPGLVVVTRSVMTTSGQASFTRSARRSSAAGSCARDAEANTRGRKRILLRRKRESPLPLLRIFPRIFSSILFLNMPESLHRVEPRRAARRPPRGNEKGERHDREPESVREGDEVHMQDVSARSAGRRRQHDARRVQDQPQDERSGRANGRADDSEEDALEQEDRPDLPALHSDGEKRPDLARSLEDRHRHRVRRGEDDDRREYEAHEEEDRDIEELDLPVERGLSL